MSAITLETAIAQRDLWIAASAAVAQKQSYRIGERELTYVNADHIASMIDYWDAKVSSLTGAAGGRRRVKYLVPE